MLFHICFSKFYSTILWNTYICVYVYMYVHTYGRSMWIFSALKYKHVVVVVFKLKLALSQVTYTIPLMRISCRDQLFFAMFHNAVSLKRWFVFVVVLMMQRHLQFTFVYLFWNLALIFLRSSMQKCRYEVWVHEHLYVYA